MAVPPIAALEIGTSKTIVLIGECTDSDKIKVLGTGVAQTTGVRKGQVFDLGQVQYSIETAVKAASDEAGIDVVQVFLAVTGDHILGEKSSGSTTIESKDGVVTEDDILEVQDIAKGKRFSSDRHVLHSLPQTYTVGTQSGILNPKGFAGRTLLHDMLLIHAQKERIENAVSAIRNAHLEVSDIAFSGICSALSVLTPDQKKNGVALVDFGGGTIDYMVYVNNSVVLAGTLGIGGDHITNDIAQAFTVQQATAEDLKKTRAAALIHPEEGVTRIPVPRETNGNERTIGVKALQTVSEARVSETLRIICDIISEAGVLPSLGDGIVLTGGGAYLRDIRDAAEQIFHLPCTIGIPVNVIWPRPMNQPAILSTAAGLLMYGAQSYRTTQGFSIKQLFEGMFKR